MLIENAKQQRAACNTVKATVIHEKVEKVQAQIQNYWSVRAHLKNSLLTTQSRIREKIESHRAELRAFTAQEAPDFNIFKILGIDRYEVVTHTPVLAALLNPKGSHGQGDCFLRSFLLTVVKLTDEIVTQEGWEVIMEKDYIDLRIVHKPSSFAIFIENKIDTQAHSGQLCRYFKLLKDTYDRGCFIFLSIHGDPPSDAGFDDHICPKDAVLKELQVISYKHDISCFLSQSLEMIKADRVKHTVRQYLDLIASL
jgi:hypothetical protein